MNDLMRTGPLSPGSTAPSLLDRVRSRDAQAWERLVELYGPLVYHWCGRQLKHQDAADVFQEVFRAVAAHIGNFRKERPGGGRAEPVRRKVTDSRRGEK